MTRIGSLRSFAAAVLLVTGLSAGSVEPAGDELPHDLSNLSWLAGSWLAVREDSTVEEVWLQPKAGQMTGMNRTTTAQGKGYFEFMRIRRNADAITFTAWPQGAGQTEFMLKEMSGQRVVFENLQHEFPQRVIYSLGGDGRLTGRVEGQVDGKLQSEEWYWTRQ